MGVCVKGMYLPPSCYFCPMTNEGFYLCKANNPYKQLEDDCEERRPNWCPLIEIPEPHGRLIDADALVEDLKHQCEEVFKIDAVSPDDFWITRDHAYNERLWKTWCESFFEYLKERDTVIPASEWGET